MILQFFCNSFVCFLNCFFRHSCFFDKVLASFDTSSDGSLLLLPFRRSAPQLQQALALLHLCLSATTSTGASASIDSASTRTATSTRNTTSTASMMSSSDKDSSDDDDLDLLHNDDSIEEEEELLLLVATCVSMQRKDPHFRQKLVWNNCVERLNKDGPFGFHNGCFALHNSLVVWWKLV